MPANNPIVGGQHITSYSNTAGSPMIAAPPAPSGSAYMGEQSYNVPMVAIAAFALILLLLFRVWGFAFVGSVKVGI